MDKGCVKDAEADVQPERALFEDVQGDVKRMFLKEEGLHILQRLVCRTERDGAKNNLLYPRFIPQEKGASVPGPRLFARMHIHYYDADCFKYSLKILLT